MGASAEPLQPFSELPPPLEMCLAVLSLWPLPAELLWGNGDCTEASLGRHWGYTEPTGAALG